MSPSLTSDPDRFSDDGWELLLAAQDTARRWRHGAMDVEHLLQTLLSERRFDRWLDPLPLDPDRLLDRLESFCADQPSANGPELYIGDALEDLLEAAERCRVAWGAPPAGCAPAVGGPGGGSQDRSLPAGAGGPQ